jgi:tetratricopeptide (TPR) repeat protein
LQVESEPPEVQASLYSAFADLYFHTGAYRGQRDAAERAARLWRELGNTGAQVDALFLQGTAERLLGQWQEGLQTLEEVVEVAREVGSLYVCAHASYHIGYSYLQSGQWSQAAAHIHVALDLGKQSVNTTFYGSTAFLQGMLNFHRGTWVAAQKWFEEVPRHYGRSNRVVARAYAPYGQGLIRAVTGNLAAGVQYLKETISISDDGGLPFILHRAQRDLAEVELVWGQAVEARLRLQPIVQSPTCEQYNDVTPMLPMLAWACMELGDERQAETLLSRATPRAETQHHYLALLDVLRVRGMLYTKQERFPEGQAVLDQALSLARGMPYPYAEAKLLYATGCLEAARGNTTLARQRFTVALSICAQLGERFYAERIERDLAVLGA